MGLPTITVEFKKLAATATNRSTRGILAVILQDDTAEWTHKTYTALEEVSKRSSLRRITKAVPGLLAGPWQVTVVRVGGEGSMTDAQTILDNLAYNWVCAVPTAFQAGLVTYIKGINTPRRVRKAKALVAAQKSADDMHIVSVANTKVTPKGEAAAIDIHQYLPRIAGVLAACPMDQSVTYASWMTLPGWNLWPIWMLPLTAAACACSRTMMSSALPGA